MNFADETLGFIGCGVMGEAMIRGLLEKGTLAAQQLIAADPRTERIKELRELYGVRATADNVNAIREASVVVLAIKPQALPEVLPQLGNARNARLVLSIMAGVRIETIDAGLGGKAVVRAMPNTPAQIGQGITVWTANEATDEAGLALAQELLGAFGEELYKQDEGALDMATALSGSAPAYIFLFMEALIDVGVHMGFARREAERLVLKSMSGSVSYAERSGLHPAELRNQVTSPGGTTAEALYQLERGGLRTVVAQAVWAAWQRSASLGGAATIRGLNGNSQNPER
ncbi:MAG: pyrroline-5-carboxylate reductase [Anaerolineae bacterium]|nr:pyrroline-5-carboxylate reductase [Anaerolineae bacterium]